MTREEADGPPSDLAGAKEALVLGEEVLDRARDHLRELSDGGREIDSCQLLAYDLAHSAAGLRTARAMLAYGQNGPVEAALASVFAADTLSDLVARSAGREDAFATTAGWHAPASSFLRLARSPEALSGIAESPGESHLDEDFELVRDSFRRFATEQIAPRAEEIHRRNEDIPEEIVTGLSEMGAFGLSVPEAYGGFATGGEHDYLGMVVATEELSRASLGAGGALITRPEILARAILKGGTDEQKGRLLPSIASGEKMVAIAVTEPDFGSDVANLAVTAKPTSGGYLLKGVKTWCTFAGRADLLMCLARTEEDRSLGHKGLSVFVVEKPPAESSGFTLSQEALGEKLPAAISGGRLEGRPIDTLGYRGMHSYELSFENWWVPEDNLVGGPEGRGKGFYLQMAGFESGRLQTAARAVGVMQAAYEAAVSYARERKVFGQPLAAYELTRVKLGRMAAMVQACRQFSYEVARLMARGEGSMEASMVKAYSCRAAEWVTREAMQLHGGMGYAEEFPISRLFVDARVLSIFEGADETLCLRVIARALAS